MRTRQFLPRPEYPRPERQRSFVHGVDWVNLNGAWEFRFDPDRRGVEEQWFLGTEPRWREQIIVPFCWESLAAWGEADAAGNDNYYSTRVYRNPLEVTPFNYRSAPRYEVGWYRRQIRVPGNEHWSGKRVILTVGAADFFTDCWCNGQWVGGNEGGFTPFEFDITNALTRSDDGGWTGTLLLRVEDRMQNNEQPVGKQWGWYSSASGIWQTVFLEPRAATYIERFEITTDINTAEAHLKVFTNGGTELAVEVTSPAGQVFVEKLHVTEGVASGVLKLGSAILWDPNDPQLYRTKLVLSDGTSQDTVHTYFGMRTLAARPVAEAGAPAALSLNGELIYIRGALYQSYHPEGVYTAGDTEALREDIIAAKRAGFDLLRIHIKIDDPLLLYYADTIGILLMADFPNFGEGGDTQTGRRRYEDMMRQAIARDFNHPSIVAWCLFNETWGFGGQTEFVKLINPSPPSIETKNPIPGAGTKLANESSYSWVQSIWKLAKSLDPTRLVEDMSVVAWDHLAYYGHGETDVNSWHFYTHNYEFARKHILEVVEKTYAGSTFNYVSGFQQGAQPLINSEYGGVGALDGDVDVSWSFKFLTNELRRHGQLSAYIYTELHDVEWERNGFLNYDRTPKDFGYDPTIVNQGDVLPMDAPPISEKRPGDEVAIDVYSSHYSRRPREEVTLHWRLSGIDSLGWMHDDLISGSKPISFPQYRVELAHRVTLQMPTETMLCTLWLLAVTPDGSIAARNYVQLFVNSGFVRREQNGRRLILRAEPQSWSSAEWTEGNSTREDAARIGSCQGGGHGFFEWEFPLEPLDLRDRTRIQIVCEASASRKGTPQTDSFAQPTVLELLLNGVRVSSGVLPNHPHDTRGSLSYLREGRGAHGYLSHATAEGALLAEICDRTEGDRIRLRCVVPQSAEPHGGLTVYGATCGRYPVAPTLIID